ncbi:hypothetical protein [Flaviaesturariibacter aridisoli]|uniref:DUF4190 domain-containing protein n=1 Tax=Flaviaesturariibacter aridisoli TaxID=2545761 RepID=A0A4R4E4I2_9BACT|nr:hypothetical protein [Flaviaesturariibacter aridisoli]TCZ73847.1 hypothetical protein E0486_03970 [Flaviaesturariibacter aridisoli]
MEQQPASNAYKTVGIIGLVLASLAFVFSFVPCLGMYAVWPGVAGVILSIISLSMAGKVNAGKGIAITGLCLAVVGTGVATWQFFALKKGIETIDTAIKAAAADTSKWQVKIDESDTSFSIDASTQQAIDSMNNAAQPEPAAAH